MNEYNLQYLQNDEELNDIEEVENLLYQVSQTYTERWNNDNDD